MGLTVGYERSALLLEWPEDSEFSGLEVRMKRLPIKRLLRIEKLFDELKAEGSDDEALVTEMLDIIGKGLLSWNYAEGGVALPAVRESLDELDTDLIMVLVRAWTRGAAAVPLDSRKSSPTGEPVPPDEEWASYLATSQENLPEPVSS